MLAPRTAKAYENGLHRSSFRRPKTKKCTPGINRLRSKLVDKNKNVSATCKLLARTTKKLDFVLEEAEDFSLEVAFEDEEQKMTERTKKTPSKQVGMHDISTLFFDLALSDSDHEENEDDEQMEMR